MDPLSDVLALLKPHTYMSGGLNMGGAWSLSFPVHSGIKIQAVISGEAWLKVDGVLEPLRLRTGDCFLLPQGRPFCVTNDLDLPPVDAYSLFKFPLNGATQTINGGGDFKTIGGRFIFTGKHAEMLLGVLPPIVHIQKESDRAAMRWAIERSMLELREPQPGSALMAEQLAYMMLVQILRLYLLEGVRTEVGWLFALADKQLSAAMQCMHENPAYRWTLPVLAERAGMSRSIFALKFKQTVGASPMEYLTRWRMLVAADKLIHTSDSIASLALALGYDSESAFSTAFKRVMGCSPRQYNRDNRTAKIQKNLLQTELAATS